MLSLPFDVGERFTGSDVVDYYDPMGASVISGGDRSEPLLTGRVPNLELDALPTDVDSSDLEVDADGCDIVPGEGVVGKSDEQGALSNPRVADDQQFEEMVVVSVSVMRSHDF